MKLTETTHIYSETVKLPFEVDIYILTCILHLLKNNRKMLLPWITDYSQVKFTQITAII